MKDLNRTKLTTRKLALALTATTCLCALGVAQASEAEVHAGADTSAGARLQMNGAEARAEVMPGGSVAGGTSASNEGRLAARAGSSSGTRPDDSAAVPPAVADRTEAALGSVSGKQIEAAVPDARLSGEGAIAAEATATVAEAVTAAALDAAVDSAVRGEIASAIESSVQGDIQSAIESDLVTEVTDSLSLP